MANLIIWNTLSSETKIYSNLLSRPCGPHLLAQWLIQFGFSVKVIDFCSTMTTANLVDITRKHIDSSTVAIGVSSTFWGSTSSENNAVYAPTWVRLARSQIELSFPKLDWILGGANSEVQLNDTWLRFHRRPEDQIREYLREKLSLNKTYVPFDILSNTGTYMDNLGIRPEEALGFEWGRGCQFKCKFCRYESIGKKKGTYLRDPSIVKQDLISNYEKYGTTRYVYVDDTTNESVEKLEYMADIAQSLPFELEWVGYGRLDLIGANKKTIKLLRDSGLRSMFFGIESFNKEASTIIGKGWNGVHGKEFLLELKDHWKGEINFQLGFIAGIEPETPEELDDTFNWCVENNIANWTFSGLSIINLPLSNLSIFDKNHTEYGYKFPHTKYPSYWVNNYWNSTLANAKATELNTRIQHVSTTSHSVFSLAAVAGVTGESLKEIMSKRKYDFIELEILSEKIVKDYVNYQLSVNI
jgi:hypothetical protein